MVFKGGQKVDTVVGAVPKATLSGTISKYPDRGRHQGVQRLGLKLGLIDYGWEITGESSYCGYLSLA